MPLPHPHPDLDALDLLVTVGERGSIRAAAAVHGITQPAASMRLATLERVIGVPLLDRATTGARLTPAGAATAAWATAVLREMHVLMAGTDALRTGQRSHLPVAASLTVAEYLLPGWLAALAAAQPSVRVALEMGNTNHVIDLVGRGDAVLGFVEGPRPPGGLGSRPVASDALVVVVGPGHPWRRRTRPLTAAALAATPLLLRETGSGTRDVFVQALAEHGLDVTPAMELGSTTALKAAAMSGTAPAVVSALAVAGELESGALVAVPLEDLTLVRTIRAIWTGARPPTGPAGRLLAIAESAAAAGAGRPA